MRNERNHLSQEIRNSFVTLRELFDITSLGYVIESQLGINKIIGGWHLRPSLGEFVLNTGDLCGGDLWMVQRNEDKEKDCQEFYLLIFRTFFLQTLFDEDWHQIRLLVTEQDVTLYIDDQQIESKPLHPVLGIFISGQTQIGKYSGKEENVQVDK